MSLRNKAGLLAASLIIVISLGAAGKAQASEKITIGRIENVILLPWGVKLPARIDTGATTSSLDARELRIKGETVEFKLPEKYGGKNLSLPIIDWHYIRSPSSKQLRPVVEVALCIGSEKIRTRVNLTDRSAVKYSMTLGRNIIKDRFVVDVKRSKVLPPKCADINSLPAPK